VDAPTHVKAAVHDQSGSLIAGLMDRDLPAGVWPLEWDGKNESGRSVGLGVYYLVVEKDGKTEKRKILVRP
jgi:flagellar hook assembly protein FlgD